MESRTVQNCKNLRSRHFGKTDQNQPSLFLHAAPDCTGNTSKDHMCILAKDLDCVSCNQERHAKALSLRGIILEPFDAFLHNFEQYGFPNDTKTPNPLAKTRKLEVLDGRFQKCLLEPSYAPRCKNEPARYPGRVFWSEPDFSGFLATDLACVSRAIRSGMQRLQNLRLA